MDTDILVSGMPIMADAYRIGEAIEDESKFLYDCTEASLPLSNEGSACVLFKTKIDEGMDSDKAWKEAWSLYEYLCFNDEKNYAQNKR